jgi:hypothetical protein
MVQLSNLRFLDAGLTSPARVTTQPPRLLPHVGVSVGCLCERWTDRATWWQKRMRQQRQLTDSSPRSMSWFNHRSVSGDRPRQCTTLTPITEHWPAATMHPLPPMHRASQTQRHVPARSLTDRHTSVVVHVHGTTHSSRPSHTPRTVAHPDVASSIHRRARHPPIHPPALLHRGYMPTTLPPSQPVFLFAVAERRVCQHEHGHAERDDGGRDHAPGHPHCGWVLHPRSGRCPAFVSLPSTPSRMCACTCVCSVRSLQLRGARRCTSATSLTLTKTKFPCP